MKILEHKITNYSIPQFPYFVKTEIPHKRSLIMGNAA